MQYIPLFDFFSFLNRNVQAVSPAEKLVIDSELDRLYLDGKAILVQGKRVSLADAKAFSSKLDHAGIVVFEQWISRHSGLKNLLLGISLSANNFDPVIVSKHRLFADFSRFISSFLITEIFKKLASGEEKDYLLTSGYIQMLDRDEQLVLQDKLSTWLRSKLTRDKEMAVKARTEQEFTQAAASLVSNEMIAFVNSFTKAFYAEKINYIDRMLEFMKFPGCTQRTGKWISDQLARLELNPEHVNKVKEIKTAVQSGKTHFRNQTGKVKKGFDPVAVTFLIVFIAVMTIVAGVIVSGDTGSAPVEIADDSSSFEHFTKEERMQMDSLLLSALPKEGMPDENFNDQFLHLPETDMNAIYREPFKNKMAERFHEDCLKDQQLIESGSMDSCNAYSPSNAKYKNYPEFKKLSERDGAQEILLLNESIYQVLVVVFNDATHTSVSSSILNPGEETKFKMNPSEIILFLPGDQWAPFQTSVKDPASLPSENFKHHFCQQDENFKSMLFSPYRLKPASAKTVKLMLNEDENSGLSFYVFDLYEALEAI